MPLYVIIIIFCGLCGFLGFFIPSIIQTFTAKQKEKGAALKDSELLYVFAQFYSKYFLEPNREYIINYDFVIKDNNNYELNLIIGCFDSKDDTYHQIINIPHEEIIKLRYGILKAVDL